MEHEHVPSGKEFVLCFDGTGYKLRGDESDSNIVKIFRMLDRDITSSSSPASPHREQYHYYQPGFGTYVSSTWLTRHGRSNKLKSFYLKAKDSAIGSSFAQHVVSGYKYLMRYYEPGDRIYFFGFSRGAYVARFLAEMLDYVGLLEKGNEELARFAFKTFARWQCRRDIVGVDWKEEERLFGWVVAFRETFCRPMTRVHFLGLFDTVNSVPRPQGARLRRSRFPFTVRSEARIIRHAVSIDERRSKFRHDLVGETRPTGKSKRARLGERLKIPKKKKRGLVRRDSRRREAMSGDGRMVYRPRGSRWTEFDSGVDYNTVSNGGDGAEQDVEEVWFPGCHADIGGGWNLAPDEEWSLSHVPLVWMVQEAQRAGLRFDPDKLKEFNCYDDTLDHCRDAEDRTRATNSTHDQNGAQKENEKEERRHRPEVDTGFTHAIRSAAEHGRIHDCLSYSSGLHWTTVLSWRVMEYLPFRRMGLEDDGYWRPIRLPLPAGEYRDIPHNAKIHNSVIRRMNADPGYRPGNLIKDQKGRSRDEIGEWEVAGHPGCLVRETFRRKKEKETIDGH